MSNERESLTKTLEQRYSNEKAGGAYNAKSAGNAVVDNFTNTFADGFTKAGQNTNLPKKDSIYLKGIDTKKYH